MAGILSGFLGSGQGPNQFNPQPPGVEQPGGGLLSKLMQRLRKPQKTGGVSTSHQVDDDYSGAASQEDKPAVI